MRRVKAMSLRDWRESAGLTQRELAKLAHVARASISHIENGYYLPTAGFAGKVCRVLSAQLDCKLHTWELFPGVFHAPLLFAPAPDPPSNADSQESAPDSATAPTAKPDPAPEPPPAAVPVLANASMISLPVSPYH